MSADPRKPTLRQYEAAIALLIIENDGLREMAGVKTLTPGRRDYGQEEIERGTRLGLIACARGTEVTFSIDDGCGS